MVSQARNQAFDYVGLFWCRNPVQNHPYEIRLRTSAIPSFFEIKESGGVHNLSEKNLIVIF
jgi:hypothetical protein